MSPSSIEWTEETWNPTTGCDRCSPGCDRCYIERTVPFRVEGRRFDEHGKMGVRLHPDRLAKPLRWRRPRLVFVNSLSDLFHTDVPVEFVARVFATMALSRRHTYQVLTKRPQRMARLLADEAFERKVSVWATAIMSGTGPHERWRIETDGWWPEPVVVDGRGITNIWHPRPWPLPNVGLGVSVESDPYTFRVEHLVHTPAAWRFVSAEPLLGPLPSLDVSQVDWLIAGGESGPDARPCHPDWIRDLRDRCAAAATPFFLKQWGEWAPLGPVYDQVDDFDEEADRARMAAASIEVDDKREVIELMTDGTIVVGYQPPDHRTWLMADLGKKLAGRELDGRTWDDMPAVGTGP